MSVDRLYYCKICNAEFYYTHQSCKEDSLKECPTCNCKIKRILEPTYIAVGGDNAQNSYGLHGNVPDIKRSDKVS